MTRDLWRPAGPAGASWGEWLSLDPLIIHAWPSLGFPLGCASVIGPLVKDRPAHFLIGFAWSMEPPEYHRTLIEVAEQYAAEHPLHRLTFIGNTPAETQIFERAGFSAVTLNHNLLVDDTPYQPVPSVTPCYDAVYNARLSPEKRPELAADLQSGAFIYFYNDFEATVPQFHAEHARLRALMPRIMFINRLTPDGCEWLFPDQINRVYAQSKVGLCLSPIEGAMRAAIEYLFAGLSIVSTPSLGGRDYYFDDEYCLIADPEPRAIREAVDQLLARAVPRAYVRARTLARIEADRVRYIKFVQSLIDEAGGREHFAERFWALTRSTNIQRWRSMDEFSENVQTSLKER